MVEASFANLPSASSRGPWELLSRWLAGDGHEERFRTTVLRPGHAAARAILGDRAEAWDATVAALDRVLASFVPLCLPLGVGGVRRDLSLEVQRHLGRAEVDGEPLLCALLRARLLPAVRRESRQRLADGAARRARRVSFDDVLGAADEGDPDDDLDPVEQHRGPEALAEQHELVNRVRAAVASLEHPVRLAQQLHMDGVSQRRIAEQLHVSRSAVRSRLELASQLLAAKLHGV